MTGIGSIRQLMWPYQPAFTGSVEVSLRTALRDAGFTSGADVLLVGFQASGTHEFPICIEPEDGPYAPSALVRARDRGRELYEQHSDRDMIHTHPDVHQEFHERLQRQMQARSVEEALAASEPGASRVFFAGMPIRVEDYEVHTVISVDGAALAMVPQLRTTMRDRFTVYPSLVHAIIHNVLNRASTGLSVPEPGRDYDVLKARAPEITQSAAASFMRYVFGCAGYWFADKTDAIVNAISALPYEGRSGSGRLIIAKEDHPAVGVLMTFREAVDIQNTQAVRKLVEASGSQGDLLATGGKVLGLGQLTTDYDARSETAFIVSVTARGTWELSHADRALMTVRDGIPQLPTPLLDAAYFADTVERVLPRADPSALLELAKAASRHEHGAMLVISSEAAAEALRLAPQAWGVEPRRISPELLSQLTAMDGGVLIDGEGYCHAIGVILDGRACGGEDPARGSRFNNAIRYLQSEAPQAVVVVYSADGGIDILPRLLPRVKRSTVQQAIEQYIALAIPGQRQTGRSDAWAEVNRLKFYLSEGQCELLNTAKEAVEKWNEEHDNFREITSPLAPDPEMNETYWLPEKD